MNSSNSKNTEDDKSVRYSCNFSNRDLKTNQFGLLLQEHKDQLQSAIILDISQNLIKEMSLEKFPLIEIAFFINSLLLFK